jgi:hypothetical protein
MKYLIESLERKKTNDFTDLGTHIELILLDFKGRENGRTKISTFDIFRTREYRWSLGSHGYAKSTKLGSTLHRFLMGTNAKLEVDHINRDKLDNRRKNLRFVTPQANCLNNGNKSVYYHKSNKKWIAEVSHKYLGSFISRKEAEKVSRNYKLKLINQ